LSAIKTAQTFTHNEHGICPWIQPVSSILQILVDNEEKVAYLIIIFRDFRKKSQPWRLCANQVIMQKVHLGLWLLKISFNNQSYPILSYVILSYPILSRGANSQMDSSDECQKEVGNLRNLVGNARKGADNDSKFRESQKWLRSVHDSNMFQFCLSFLIILVTAPSKFKQ
jgi:hypothetical protein